MKKNNPTLVFSDFKKWVAELSNEYRKSQIKASIKINGEMVGFYFNLGREISNTSYKSYYGSHFYENLSNEFKSNIVGAKGFSPVNLWYMERFYTLYKDLIVKIPQLVEELSMVPWGHHRYILDKCKTKEKALFFIRKTIQNNWSRSVLLNFLDTDLYERQGKSINNFKVALPEQNKDLADELTKDPYCFNFLMIEDKYTEKELKDVLVSNIQKFMLELGTGFAYLGREYRLQVNETELFIDLLFYNTKAHAYVVVEIKKGSFKPEYTGQLGTYVVAVDHLLRTEKDGKTIGILICKDHDNVLARFGVESSSQPLGISSYELSKFIPENFKNSLPSIEELEESLKTNKK